MIQYAPVSLEDKALAFRKDAVRLKRGTMVAPTMGIVYPTYSCNMRCFGCVSNAENAKPASIDLKVFDRFLSEFTDMGGESIEFSGGGEPTLHPKFQDMIAMIKFYGLQFGMITNGTYPAKVAHAFDYESTRYIRVSIYTVHQLDHLRQIVRDRNSAGSSSRVGGKLLLGTSDIPLLEYMVKEILATGVDFVSIKAKRHCSDDPVLLPEKEQHELQNLLQVIMLQNPGKVFGGTKKTVQRGQCWLSPLHTVVDALGTVWICCYYQDRVEDISIGNLYTRSFMDLWFGSEHTEALSRVDTSECNFYDCRFHVYNDILNEEFANDRSNLAFI